VEPQIPNSQSRSWGKAIGKMPQKHSTQPSTPNAKSHKLRPQLRLSEMIVFQTDKLSASDSQGEGWSGAGGGGGSHS
jgi:hypothetical protein